MDVFFVESPGQIISAFEYINKSTNEKILYVRLNGSDYNDNQIKSTIGFYLERVFIDVIYIRSNFDFIKEFIPKVLSSSCFIYLGCHKSKYTRLINFFRRKYTLLDDGIASLVYVKKGGRMPLFTCLNIESNEGQLIEKHEFSFLKSLSRNELKTRTIQIFYGAKYVECGIIDIEEYLKVLRDALKGNENLLYVAHRAESNDNLSLYMKLGLSVVRWEYPSEIEVVSSISTVNRVYGLYSAALVTTKILLPDVEVNGYYSCKLNVSMEKKDDIYGLIHDYADNLY